MPKLSYLADIKGPIGRNIVHMYLVSDVLVSFEFVAFRKENCFLASNTEGREDIKEHHLVSSLFGPAAGAGVASAAEFICSSHLFSNSFNFRNT
jgi:hypothetical protein